MLRSRFLSLLNDSQKFFATSGLWPLLSLFFLPEKGFAGLLEQCPIQVQESTVVLTLSTPVRCSGNICMLKTQLQARHCTKSYLTALGRWLR